MSHVTSVGAAFKATSLRTFDEHARIHERRYTRSSEVCLCYRKVADRVDHPMLFCQYIARCVRGEVAACCL